MQRSVLVLITAGLLAFYLYSPRYLKLFFRTKFLFLFSIKISCSMNFNPQPSMDVESALNIILTTRFILLAFSKAFSTVISHARLFKIEHGLDYMYSRDSELRVLMFARPCSNCFHFSHHLAAQQLIKNSKEL